MTSYASNPRLTSGNGHQSISSSALVRTNGHSVADSEDEPLTIDDMVHQLRRALTDELCALRCDVDTLKKGGWVVNVGPFKPNMRDTNDDERQAAHKAITTRIESKISSGNVKDLVMAGTGANRGS